MKLIDRMLLWGFFKAWIVCFVSLVSLYLVIDLFGKFDDFLDAAENNVDGLLEVMGVFYLYQVVLIFDRLCGVIVLLASMFTIAWMQRHNELLPLLSAGVPIRRVLWPVFLGALVMLGINTANRELLMPQFADRLQNPASDPNGERVKLVNGAYEPNGILVSGQKAYRHGQLVLDFTCTVPEKLAGALQHISAKEARYIPPGPDKYSGGWLMTETTPPDLPHKLKTAGNEPVLEVLDPGKFFLRTERVDFDLLIRTRNWYQYASTYTIFREMQKAESSRLAAMAVQVHIRLTLPLLTLLMVLMGVSNILRDQSRNIFLNAGICLVLAALFHAVCYLAKHLGENEYVSPPLAAWLPVFLFGPLALTMFDSIHT